jgi:hypothetical protein
VLPAKVGIASTGVRVSDPTLTAAVVALGSPPGKKLSSACVLPSFPYYLSLGFFPIPSTCMSILNLEHVFQSVITFRNTDQALFVKHACNQRR